MFAAIRAALYARDAAKHTERGADEAKRSADAATDQIEASQNTSLRELRAYVTATRVNLSISTTGSLTNFIIQAVHTNSGQTTARLSLRKIRATILAGGGFAQQTDPMIIAPGASEQSMLEFGSGGDITSLQPVVRIFVEYLDYAGATHTEDSFWTWPLVHVPPVGEIRVIDLVCHSKIDETVGRFIDPKGEEAHEAKLRRHWEMALRHHEQSQG